AEKLAALRSWRRELDDVYRGNPSTPIGASLVDAVARYQLPHAEFDALINGMEMDVNEEMRAPSQAVLDLYCRRVAGTIGVLALSVFGCAGAVERKFAITLGRALQLTNIARDIAEDAARGRLYVPREILDAFDARTLDPAAFARDPRVPAIRGRLCALAQSAFEDAELAFAACGNRRCLWPALAMMGIYRRLLDKVAAAAPGAPRATIPRPVQLSIALRALVLARP
ncbi:MAG TPA: squalene/phytoene synthase family protein, partial [Alphaproteobacteria bacterium]|nr:squalene/phytoene synthase family protein [Alphaproteobacteria bacterium]